MLKRLLPTLLVILTCAVFALAQKSTEPTKPIEVGQIAPDFTLTTNAKKDFTLSKVEGNTVLVFYRGYW